MLRKIINIFHKSQKSDNTNFFSESLGGFYWSVIRVFPFYFAGLFVLMLLRYLVDNVTFPYTSKWAIQIFESASTGVMSYKIWWVLAVYVAIFVTGSILQYVQLRFRPIVARYTNYVLYRRVYQNDVDFFITHPAGQITNHLSTIAGKLEAITLQFWANVVKVVLGILILSASVMVLDWRIAVVVFVAMVLRTGWRFVWQRKINRAIDKLQEMRAAIGGMRTDSLANATTVKLLGNADYENDYMWHRQDEIVAHEQKIGFWRRVQDRPALFMWFISNLAVIVMCWRFIADGTIGLADAMFIFTAGRSITREFDQFVTVLVDYSEDKASAKRAYADAVRECTVLDAPYAKDIKKVKGDIEFDNVTFGYGKGDVIHGFDLCVKSHDKVGIVGLSGAGKTTLVNLLLRAYDVEGGAIKVDGVDIRDVTQKSLHKQISFVPQEAVLFNRTILENIRYAKPKASRAAVIRAAKQARCHEFISGLPNGYDTLVGNRGVKLSGGQRQRIAIARAILKDAPILLLDEATSALDTQSEKLIQGALNGLMRGRTTFVIAHRLSTILDADIICVIKDGEIVEMGTDAELCKLDGEYKKLRDIQFKSSSGKAKKSRKSK